MDTSLMSNLPLLKSALDGIVRKVRTRAYKRNYYARNKDMFAASKKAYKARNKEKTQQYHQSYEQANKDRLNAYRAEWRRNYRQEHPRKARQADRKDYLLKKQRRGASLQKPILLAKSRHYLPRGEGKQVFVCEECKKVFRVHLSQRKGEHVFCSGSCSVLYRIRTEGHQSAQTRPCGYCGKPVTRYPSKAKSKTSKSEPKNFYCNRAHYLAWRHNKEIKVD